jgi:hypothetical protein
MVFRDDIHGIWFGFVYRENIQIDNNKPKSLYSPKRLKKKEKKVGENHTHKTKNSVINIEK